MKRKIFASLFILVAASVFAQQHVSVPLDDPVYRVIENALIQNYIRPLPTAKPYSLATVLSALREMVQSPRISPLEKKAAEGLIARFEASKTQPWYQIGGYRYDSENEGAKTAAESEQAETEQAQKKPIFTAIETGGSHQSTHPFFAFKTTGVVFSANLR